MNKTIPNMNKTIPTVGRNVLYTLTEQDAKDINDIRARSEGELVGNDVVEGNQYPAIIVAVWGDAPESPVTLQVLLDGNDNFLVTSVSVGEGPMTYAWHNVPAPTNTRQVKPVVDAEPEVAAAEEVDPAVGAGNDADYSKLKEGFKLGKEPADTPAIERPKRKRGLELFSRKVPIQKPADGFDWKENARKAYEQK